MPKAKDITSFSDRPILGVMRFLVDFSVIRADIGQKELRKAKQVFVLFTSGWMSKQKNSPS